MLFFFFSSRRRHTRFKCDWSSDVCSSDLAQQILKQLVFQKEIEYEAKRIGMAVSDQERADRIRQYVPTAFSGGTFVGMDRYSAEVQARFQLTVPVFEELIRQGLLEEKFRKLVTDGI